MTDDPNSPRVLLSVASDVEAASIVTALDAYDIRATATGGFISGFRAEAPGDVKVIVKAVDLDRARQALAELQGQQGEIDWPQAEIEDHDKFAGAGRWRYFAALTIAALCFLDGTALIIWSVFGGAQFAGPVRLLAVVSGLVIDLVIAILAIRYLRQHPPDEQAAEPPGSDNPSPPKS
jgi:hypothetical protein